ncbi:SDR family NAD(P)-dependent oxidoreductase [Microbacterium sp. PRF11]|jgi:NAD(P)-dependent dehydrogenase (short-subunit alcohol dehydrogenase family)|uniref:SDR family NAD(P)-dependent oxidoreductase n=1 Tax=Microbacterium sp. PRF11 TaxID=2962593 RepID=UPI0037CAA85D
MSSSISIDLSGKTAVVTGSTQGIGLAIARRLHDAGAEVVVNGRSVERVDRTVAGLGDRARGVAADVTTAEGAAQLVDTVGPVDVLVNNLGIFGSTPALEIDDEQWQRFLDTNVVSAARLIRLLLPGMTQRGWGRVLNIASDSAVVIPEEMIHYGASKSALLAVSRGFAKAAAGTGVTVNSVIAGPTHTEGVEDFVYEMVDNDLPWDDAQREFMRTARPQSLVQRLIEPEEIANMVVYLASPLASATTGGALRVDGGYVDSILP